MEESKNTDVSLRRAKRLQSDTSLNKTTLQSDEESRKVILNGTGNSTSEEESLSKSPTKTIRITKVAKSSKTEQSREALKYPQKVIVNTAKDTSPGNSPSSSSLSRDGFQGFEDANFGEEEEDRRKEFFNFVENLESEEWKEADNSDIGEASEREEEGEEEEMTVDTAQTSDTDSNQMEIDDGSDRVREKAKDSDVDILEIDIPEEVEKTKKGVKLNTQTENSTKTVNLKGSGAKVEYCGGCEAVVNDTEEGICCDGTCERWFHLRCSGLSQLEYDELGLDENAKWACFKCSGKPPPVIPAGAKPLLSVRKDLTKPVTTPASTKRKSIAKETVQRGPRVDISNPAFLKPFDFGWKRELVYRSTIENTPGSKRNGDIYYYTPKGKKLRSLREISDHLAGSDLTQDNFTFHKEPIGIEDPEKEIIRDAKLKLANRDPLATPSPSLVKKGTPKITKAVKAATPKGSPKLTATVSQSVSKTVPSKVLLSATPRVNLKVSKQTTSTNARTKVTPSNKTQAFTSQSQKVAYKPPSRKSSLSVAAPKTPLQFGPNVVKEFRQTNENVNAADAITDKGIVQDIEKNRRNKFRRYGLLANAKARRKTNGEFSSSSDSDDCDKSGLARSHNLKTTSIAKAIKTLESDATHSDQTSKESLLVSPAKSSSDSSSCEKNEENNALKKSPLITDELLLPGPNTRRPSLPEIQFRPGNPSSYGCQTQYGDPGPSSSLYDTNTSYETVLIVDRVSSSHNFKSPSQQINQSSLDPSLIFNNDDSSFKIISVDSLSSADQVMKYHNILNPTLDHLCTSPKKIVPQTRVNEEINQEVGYRRGTEDSPVSLNSSSTEEIVLVDEDSDDQTILPHAVRNSPPKLYSPSGSTSNHWSGLGLGSPPLLQHFTQQINQITSNQPPHLYSVTKQPISSQKSNNHDGTSPSSSQSGSKYDAYRKLKQERLLVRLKAKRDLARMNMSYKRERKLFIKRKNEEKKLRVVYLKLKVKMKEMKAQLMQKKIFKLE